MCSVHSCVMCVCAGMHVKAPGLCHESSLITLHLISQIRISQLNLELAISASLLITLLLGPTLFRNYKKTAGSLEHLCVFWRLGHWSSCLHECTLINEPSP